jgi:hypothetical protein
MVTHKMASHDVQVVQVQAVPNRAILRAGLESTCMEFHRVLDSVVGEKWHRKSLTCDWTMGEVLLHLTWALEQLPEEVESARRGKGMFNYPKWIANPGSYWIIHWEARNCNPETLRRRYDAATDAAIAALEKVPESDWGLGARFYGERFYTVADLFETPIHHLAEHTGQPARNTQNP